MYHSRDVSGLDMPEVQLVDTTSPTSYWFFSMDIFGLSSGISEKKSVNPSHPKVFGVKFIA